jgi:hypothetical protein
MNPHLLSSRGDLGLTMTGVAHSFFYILLQRIRNEYSVDPFFDKKKRWPKRRRKRATSHQKRTVNRISRGG